MTKEDEQSKLEGAKSTNTDPMSPYFVHASDHPGQVFVSDLLTDLNYGDWVADMSEVLFAKNKICFVNGKLPQPDESSSDQPHWLRCDAMVKGWLKAAMSKEVRNSVRYATTAVEIWTDLKDRYGKSSGPRAYEVRRAISLLGQESLGISAYYTKLRSLWDELRATAPPPKCTCGKCTCGIQKRLDDAADKEKLDTFLMGLTESFSAVRSHILTLQPQPSLNVAFHLVLEDEQQRAITASRAAPDSAAFQSRRNTEDSDRQSDYERPKCTNCNRMGHLREECYDIIGYPEGYFRGKTSRMGSRRGTEGRRRPRAAHVAGDIEEAGLGSLGLTPGQMDKLRDLLQLPKAPNSTSPQAAATTSEYNSPPMNEEHSHVHEELPEVPRQVETLRRSERSRQAPQHLADYDTSLPPSLTITDHTASHVVNESSAVLMVNKITSVHPWM
ncbi:hypothetical protein LINPERPRIM_LOCUS36641 [Linum perenne]